MIFKGKPKTIKICDHDVTIGAPKPSEQALFLRCLSGAGEAERTETKLLYTVAALGMAIKAPKIAVPLPKRELDGEYAPLAIIEYAEKVVDAIAEALPDFSAADLMAVGEAVKDIVESGKGGK